ncbi:cysteine peptidase family C39 domain-containing protein [Cyclobacterium plantarum]|uniref:Peptidase C39 domain-containing protein n=1 Tax=Cyclobacterium plantarum TaxID=2716263 RepID=A0ABX0H7Q8_9BACT|nr:cysteine peptidase family C39 domain-containing protein [Cyclobacterium plantarum]NHE57808.1 hypothetical protein [Cyclobacterium plantarum]
MKTTFPFFKQLDAKNCGPTCLRIIAKHYGKLISLQEIRENSETTRSGSNLLKLSEAAEAIGFKTKCARPGIKFLINKFVLYLIQVALQDQKIRKPWIQTRN